MQLDAMGVLGEPFLSWVIKPVAGAIVDDEEELSWRIFADQLLKKLMKSMAIEDIRKTVGEVGGLQ